MDKGKFLAWAVLVGAVAVMALHIAAVLMLDWGFVVTHGSPDALLLTTVLGVGAELWTAQAACNRIRRGRWLWPGEE